MATEPTAAGPRGAGSAHEGGAPRTGPVGRLARLLLGAALGWLAYDLWADRAFIVRELDPGLLVLTGFAVFGAYHIAGLAGLGRVMLAVLAVAGAGSAVLAAVLEGTVWAAPVSWLVWGLDLGVLVAIAASTLVAAIIGTPGCEIGVFRDIARRLRREPGGTDALFCLVGLHHLDAWEARRPWRHAADRGVRRGGDNHA